jgi:hypothetical protein
MMRQELIPKIITSILFLLVVGFVYIATARNAYTVFSRTITTTPNNVDRQKDGQSKKTLDAQPLSVAASGMDDSVITSFFDKIYRLRDYIDDKSNEKIWGKLTLIDIYGLAQRAIGKEFIKTSKFEIFKDSENKLNIQDLASNVALKKTYRQDLEELSRNLLSFKNNTDALNIPLLFVFVPPRILKGHIRMPVGMDNLPFDESSVIIDLIKGLKIDFIDLEKEIFIDNIPLDTIFYKTDHHWTIQTAFWAYARIFNRLKDIYGFHFDPKHAKITNFNSINIQYGFLGSIGQRLGKYYVGLDDFTYLEPKFDTDYTLFKQDNNYITTSISGPFSEAILDKNKLKKAKNSEPLNRYAVYYGGDFPHEITVNHNQSKYKALIIKDSFALPVAAFLSLNFHEVQMIDLRWYNHDVSVTKLVNEFLPDVIIFIHKPSSLFNKNYLSELVFRFD